MERQSGISERLARCGRIASDYSFINIWGWAEEYGLQWACRIAWSGCVKPNQDRAVGAGGRLERRGLGLGPEDAGTVVDRIVRVPEPLALTLTPSSIRPGRPRKPRALDYLYKRQELVNSRATASTRRRTCSTSF